MVWKLQEEEIFLLEIQIGEIAVRSLNVFVDTRAFVCVITFDWRLFFFSNLFALL